MFKNWGAKDAERSSCHIRLHTDKHTYVKIGIRTGIRTDGQTTLSVEKAQLNMYIYLWVT